MCPVGAQIVTMHIAIRFHSLWNPRLLIDCNSWFVIDKDLATHRTMLFWRIPCCGYQLEAFMCWCRWSRRFLDVSGSGSLVFVSNVAMHGDNSGTAAVLLSDASVAMHIEGTICSSFSSVAGFLMAE